MTRLPARARRIPSRPKVAAVFLLGLPLALASCGGGDEGGEGTSAPRAFGEYARVEYHEERTVLVDGVPRGKTGELIEVERGVRIFSLEGRLDFEPDEIEMKIERTTFVSPAVVEFSGVATDVEEGQ